MVNINQKIAQELGVRAEQVEATVALLDGGATVPFIARYRKEATGALDDAQLRTLEERLGYLRELEDRRKAILESVREQGKLDAALEASILAADSKARLEDIYLPFKPKRRTKAEIAKEAGLEPLAFQLMAEPNNDPKVVAEAFVNPEKGVADAAAALDGARAILVERFDEDADLIGALREEVWTNARMTSKVRDGKKTEGEKFADYFEFSEPLTKLPSHRILAMFRGEKEEILDLQIQAEAEPSPPGVPSVYELKIMKRFGIADLKRAGDRWMIDTVRWAWRTKIQVHLNIDLRMRLWNAAETEAVRVFASNLRDLLLAAPAGTRVTMGLDPGFRTGVKVAVTDATGKVVDTAVIYPHEPQRQWNEALAILGKLALKHRVELIAIGNGTASRETDKLAADLVKGLPDLKMTKIVVSEAGASVYSALGVRLGGVAGPRRHPARRGVNRAAAPGSSRRARQDRTQGDRRRPVPARPRPGQARQIPRRRGRRLRERRRRRRQHRVRSAARARVGRRLRPRLEHRGTPRRQRAVQVAQGVEGRAAARPQGVRAVRGLPAHPRRRGPARRLRCASGSLSGGAPDSQRHQERHQGADRAAATSFAR
ncbi:transcriptional accessory protein Tex/SPT6 [Bradyrhizobium sp. GM22.5]